MKVTYDKKYQQTISGPDWKLYTDVNSKDSLIVHNLLKIAKTQEKTPFNRMYAILHAAYEHKTVRSSCDISYVPETGRLEITTKGVFPRFYILKTEEEHDYGTATVGHGTPFEKQIKVQDWVQARFNNNRLVSISTLVNNEGYILMVENPESSGRTSQKMWLSEESFAATIATSHIFFECKKLDLVKLTDNASNGKIEYNFSKNLIPLNNEPNDK